MENPESDIFTIPPGGRRSHGKVTLAEVAARAGVATMTVSRLLRAPQSVRPGTAERILLALRETGYAPNKQAGSLASGRSAMVAVLIPSVANSIFAETIQGLSDTLQPAGLELMLAPSGYSHDREENQLRALLGWAPAAVVVTGRHHSPGSIQLMRRAREAGTPVIEMWDKHPETAEFTQIGFNHHEVGQVMARHLLDCGYDDLIFLDSGVVQDYRAHERGQGFLQAARQAGAKVRIVTAASIEPMAAGRLAIQGMTASQRPRAIAFANDHLAVGALLQALDMQIELPQQLALLGFGDFPIASQLGGGLSTLAVPRQQIGQECGRSILSALNLPMPDDETRPAPMPLEPRLVIRQTT
ncbi:MAG: LacI family DNA-binding transcriptional regulator [Polaromonas sp.]|nr:LacI family DNA-binding transcriptional regulator [Polaromonas sp.]